jgi:hypothetical protein
MAALGALDTHKVYIRNLPLAGAIQAANYVIRTLDFDRYVMTSDDVVVTQEAYDAVAHACTPDAVATGWCPLDETSDLVNITKSALRGTSPAIRAYDFYSRAEVDAHPADPVPTGFVGMGLTALHRSHLETVMPLGCFLLTDGRGFSSDFHLSRKLLDAGVPMVAPKAGFIRHVKERWNELDQAPSKRLLIGERAPEVVYHRPGLAPMTLITSQTLKQEVHMSDRIATEDIVEKNENGQNVVVVPAGQPIPDGVDVPKSKSEATPADEPAVEDKAVRSSRSTSRRKKK